MNCWREREGGGHTQFCDTLRTSLGMGRGQRRWGWEGGCGGREGRQDGIKYHVAKLPNEFIEGAEGVGHRRRGKGSARGTDVASVSLRF